MAAADLPSVALVSLGCPKNLVDSERMLAALALDGFAVTADPDGADVAVVNTCAFLDLARAESDQHIDALEALKTAGRLGRIVVAGCMAQRYGRGILARHGGVDAVVGLAGRDGLAAVCRRVLRRRRRDGPTVCVGPLPESAPDDRVRLRLTPRHYAYLRITEGCDNRCAYCAIPEIRGPLRSKPPGQVLAEAEELVADGARELILIGQDTTAYGRDRPAYGRDRPAGGCDLAGLIEALRDRLDVPWIRLMYTHPASFGPEVIAQLAAGPPVVPYADLPLQHINSRILRGMGRRVDRPAIEDLLGRLRAAAGGLAIRTSFIVGYPGETEAEFEELAAFLAQGLFDHVGVFVYSPEAGTRAAELPDRPPPEVARARWDRLMASAEVLARAAAARQEGRTLDVLVDGADETGRLVARHGGQAPEVDSVVLVPTGSAAVGTFARVRVTGAEGYDLVAGVVGDPIA